MFNIFQKFVQQLKKTRPKKRCQCHLSYWRIWFAESNSVCFCLFCKYKIYFYLILGILKNGRLKMVLFKLKSWRKGCIIMYTTQNLSLFQTISVNKDLKIDFEKFGITKKRKIGFWRKFHSFKIFQLYWETRVKQFNFFLAAKPIFYTNIFSKIQNLV